MVDLSSIKTGIDVAKSGWILLEYIYSVVGEDVIATFFKYDGTPIDGSEKIELERHHVEGKPSVWWFSVKPIDDYAFVREPVTPSCAYEIIGTVSGELPDSRYWRWIAPAKPGVIISGNYEPPNLKVDFMVFGYKPKALLKRFAKK